MEKFETFLELSKYDTETKWENTTGKITPADLLNAGLPQIFDLLKKKKKKGSICKMQYLQRTIKWSITRWGIPVLLVKL